MNEFLKFLIFKQNDVFIFKKDFSFRKKSILEYFKLIFDSSNNKFSLVLGIRELFFETISYFYLIPAVILYLFNFRFISINPNSIGTYSEELEVILLRNKRKRKKLILLEPKNFSSNRYWVDIIYQNQLIKITSNFISIILTPFTYIKFIITDAYYPYDRIYFQRQFYYLNKEDKKKFIFDHEILFKSRYISARSDILKYKELKKQNKFFLRPHREKKICFLHVRIEKNLKLRNSNFINYIPAIKYLIKNGYEIVYFSTINPDLKLNGFNFFDLNIDENKKKQIHYLLNSEIFFGQISGPFFLANFLDKKLIITDLVIFNHLLISSKFVVITKKFIKNGKLMKLNEIFNNNLQCIWNNNILKNLNIESLDNNDQEILEATKEMIEEKKLDQHEIKKFFIKNKIKFKFMNYSILRGTSNSFLKKII